MNDIKIVENGSYLPKYKITSEQLEQEKGLEKGFIQKRTGIRIRHYAQEESIEDIAYQAVENLFKKEVSKEEIGLIIVATTSTNQLMPGIANTIQKRLEISACICLDILAGCSGYINAFDIAKMYIATGRVKRALVVGVEVLSKLVNQEDIGTSIILADGAGATLIEETKKVKKYCAHIEAEGKQNHILTCTTNDTIVMEGKEIYKYAVTKPVENVQELLKQAGETMEQIKYIVPHQSNMKIMKAIANRLPIKPEKIYTNIETVGNTFCASIPIALNEMMEKKLLQEGDKIILLGYGGGLNTGSILLEI